MQSRLERAMEAQRKVNEALALRLANNPDLAVWSGVPQPTNPVASKDPHANTNPNVEPGSSTAQRAVAQNSHPSPDPHASVPPLSEQCRDNPDVEPSVSTAHRAVAPRTEAQKAAARANGAKSRGPVSEAGKARSRLNAAKHGFCSQSLQTAPPDLRSEVEAEVDLYCRDKKPRNHAQQRMVELAALAAARLLRLEAAERARTQERIRHARHRWVEKRRDEVEQLMTTLAGGEELPRTLRVLRSTAHGCRALARLLRAEARRLAMTGTRFDQKAIFYACGLPLYPTGPDNVADGNLEFWQAVFALMPAHLRDFYSGRVPAPLWTLILQSLPEENTAREQLIAFLNAQADALMQRARRIWIARDQPDYKDAPVRAQFDETPEARLLARYMNDANRMLHAADRGLRATRNEEARRRREQDQEPPGRNEPGATEVSVSQYVVARRPPTTSPRPLAPGIDKPDTEPIGESQAGVKPPEPAGGG